MFCPKCGTQLPNEAKFCNKCGEAIPAGSNAGVGSSSSSTAVEAALQGRIDVFKVASVILAALLCAAYFIPMVTASVLGFTASMSMKDLTFGMQVYGSSINGSPAAAVAIILPIIALAIAVFAKEAPVRSLATILDAVILLVLTIIIQGQFNETGYGLFIMAAGYWVYIFGTIAQIALSIACIVKNVRDGN